jgi:hypothetical protein
MLLGKKILRKLSTQFESRAGEQHADGGSLTVDVHVLKV